MAALIFYMHDGPNTFRFELAGNLAGADVSKLEQAWRTASSTVEEKILAVDVTFLTSVDERGRDLLTRWWRAGAHFAANSPLSRTLVESITGLPHQASDPAVGPTFDARFTAVSLRAVFLALAFVLTLLFPSKASAGESAAVLERYITTLLDKRALDHRTVTVEVEASVPKLNKQAHVEAIRRWNAGKRQYQFIALEGDSLIRTEVVARYLALDTEPAPATALTKSNYRFHFVTTQETKGGTAYVFEITPRKKRQGMIAGQLWIDAESGLVTHLAGRLVRNPSVLLRHVDITQEIEIRNGATFGRETHLHMDTRFTGRAELTIREHAYSEVDAREVAESVTP